MQIEKKRWMKRITGLRVEQVIHVLDDGRIIVWDFVSPPLMKQVGKRLGEKVTPERPMGTGDLVRSACISSVT